MVIFDIIFKVALLYFVVEIYKLTKENKEECDRLDDEYNEMIKEKLKQEQQEDSLVLMDHPELYDSEGNLIQESYLVVCFEQQQPPMEY